VTVRATVRPDEETAMRIGVITFPGSLDAHDALQAIATCGGDGVPLWHGASDLSGVDAVVLPGGFSYGDYLRCGAVAHRAPIMDAVKAFAADGGPVLGICNGFQILCESGLLPGALLRNAGLRFTCMMADLTVETDRTPWTRGFVAGEHTAIPLKNGEGRYYADDATLDRLEANGQVVFRYLGNVNGSSRDIAGVCNEAGNVVGLMPHPEHAVDPLLWGGDGGRGIFESVLAGVTAPA
jgi:phosphoribosylformylglycinamidine synthase subunit PurQ / glutaminase